MRKKIQELETLLEFSYFMKSELERQDIVGCC